MTAEREQPGWGVCIAMFLAGIVLSYLLFAMLGLLPLAVYPDPRCAQTSETP